MTSASTLAIASRQAMPAGAAKARAVRSHAARVTHFGPDLSGPDLLRPVALLEPLVLLLTGLGASLLLTTIVAGIVSP